MTNAELGFWYRHYNKKYFGGKLPAAVVKFSNMSKASGELGIAHLGCDEIYISKHTKWSDRICRGTLLHEMVHLLLPKRIEHGRRFEKEMLRLAKAGAFKGVW